MATREYRIRLPRDVTVPAACEQVRCESWKYGWETTVDEATPLGGFQAAYIRQTAGRTFKERGTPDGLTVFRFGRHQRCFAEHRTRPVTFLAERQAGPDARRLDRGPRRPREPAI